MFHLLYNNWFYVLYSKSKEWKLFFIFILSVVSSNGVGGPIKPEL
jgi:hypothetical protein